MTILDVSPAEGRGLAAEIEAAGGSARFRDVDVRDEAAVKGAVEEAVADFGRLDAMHANAGIEFTKRIVDTTLEEWERVIGQPHGRPSRVPLRDDPDVRQSSGPVVVTASPHAFVPGPMRAPAAPRREA